MNSIPAETVAPVAAVPVEAGFSNAYRNYVLFVIAFVGFMCAVDKIVKQGAELQAKGRKLAVAKAKEARAAVVDVREAVTARADAARSRTMDAVSKLEKAFENRVQGAISKLGVPTARDVRALSRGKLARPAAKKARAARGR
jgi:poly(hydroxyalkanoate) granule-associated protein